MQNTGDTAEYRADLREVPSVHWQSPTRLRAIYEAGGYVKTDGWTSKSIKRLEARRQWRRSQ